MRRTRAIAAATLFLVSSLAPACGRDASKQPASAPDPASQAPGGFSVLGSTPAGQTLFIKLPGAQTLDSGVTQTADRLGKLFDAKPTISGAFADSQTKSRGGAMLTAKLKGGDIRGWIFCSVEKKGADATATATVVYASADASRADVAALAAFLPAPVKVERHNFPDGSGSVDLPSGWTTQQQSLTFGVAVTGPAGQTVVMGNSLLVNTPDGALVRLSQQNYQMAMQTYQRQMQQYQQALAMHQRFPNTIMPIEPQKPVPPDPERDMPQLLFCRYCAGPDDVLKFLYPAMEKKARNAGGLFTTLDKIIEVIPADPNPLIANDKAGIAYLAVTDHNGDKATHLRVINRIETYPIFEGKDTWTAVFNTMRAPDATFDADLPVMNGIMSSFKLNMGVVAKQIATSGDTVRKMGEDSERQLLKRARDFDAQQAENFNRFQSQQAARQQAMHDSASDFIEYLKGVRDVYDTSTGKTESVDLFHVNGIVNGMNSIANDPTRFVQIPLRYERQKERAMRIWGYVLLVIGILFLVLFLLAELGGGHIGVHPFVISAFLIALGARFITSGKGMVRAAPAAPASSYPHPCGGVLGEGVAASAPPVAVAAQVMTVELPMSPEVAAAIERQAARGWRIVKYLSGGFMLLFVAVGAVIAVACGGGGDGLLLAGLFAAIGVATAVMILGISWLTTRRPVNRDLRGTTYLRTTGPIQVVRMSGGGMLRLADRAFLMNGRDAIRELSALSAGRVDYSPHGHVILAAWDSQGRSIYCAPGYNVQQ